jgi:TM2 domain-containing membrane protein YozV
MSSTNSERLATSYILCAVWFLGLGGLHRLYNGKIGTGLLWLLTFGVFGFGQFVDVFLIPNMIDEYQLKLMAKNGLDPNGLPLSQPAIALTATRPTSDQLMVKLLKAAQIKGGKLSVTQGVMATGASFAEVEAVLKQMLKSGYVSINNDPDTGTVFYHFHEL